MIHWGIISLISLVVAIGFGFFRKLNTGIIAIAFAFIVGNMAGMKDSAIISGWGTGLSVMLMGVTFLFSIAQTNGTLELFARKSIGLVGKKTWAIPIVIYLLATLLAAIGPGTIPVMALMIPIAMAIAAEMKISPLMLTPLTILGASGGGISPIAPTGIIGITLAEKQGIMDIGLPYFYSSMITETLVAVILYFVFGGYKLKNSNENIIELPKYNRDQLVTMLGIVIMVVFVLITRSNVGLAAFLTGVFLLLFKVADERKTIMQMPWGTILLVCGVGVLMNLAIKLKGIEVLALTLSNFMDANTAAPIMALTAGIMSWFSSTSGVVMPTLIPTVGNLVSHIPGTLPLELISAITYTSHSAGISPASTGGALAFAAYSANANITLEQQNKLFLQMFLTAVAVVSFLTFFAATGFYRIWGI